MLIDYLKESYQEFMAKPIQAPAVNHPHITRPAANADSFVKTGIQARRQRRQRRLERMASHSINGWTVRTW